jgi:hypothetical protein
VPARPVTLEIGFLLQRAHRQLRLAHNEALRPLGLTIAHAAVLGLLGERGDLSQRELFETIGADKSTMVNLVDELERQGRERPRGRGHGLSSFFLVCLIDVQIYSSKKNSSLPFLSFDSILFIFTPAFFMVFLLPIFSTSKYFLILYLYHSFYLFLSLFFFFFLIPFFFLSIYFLIFSFLLSFFISFLSLYFYLS